MNKWLTMACVVIAFPVAPALAARVNDAVATRAYLRASEVYTLSQYRSVGAEIAVVEARASEIARQCPSILTYAPRDVALEELGEEMNLSLFYAAAAPISSLTLRFSRTIDRLAWSDRKLTKWVHSQAAEERAAMKLALPDICTQIEMWKANAYASLPSEASDFFKHVNEISSDSPVGPDGEARDAAITRSLGRYEGPVEKRTAKRITRLEVGAEDRLSAAVATAKKKLAAALGVSEL